MQRWLIETYPQIKALYLLSCSPEPNPDEMIVLIGKPVSRVTLRREPISTVPTIFTLTAT